MGGSRKSKRFLKVFLCHSAGDKRHVRSLYKRLRADGFEPWLDEENLLPGQEWDREITKAVRSSDVVVVCCSYASINKAGFIQKEIKYALDVADEQPENAIFIIPLKLEECEIPDRLRRWHWVNLFDKRGYEKLKHSLQARAIGLGLTSSAPKVSAKRTTKRQSRPKVISKEEKALHAYNKLIQIIVDELGVDENQVTPNAHLIEDLGANELDMVELVMRCEEEFGMEIPDEAEAWESTTVKQLFQHIIDASK